MNVFICDYESLNAHQWIAMKDYFDVVVSNSDDEYEYLTLVIR